MRYLISLLVYGLLIPSGFALPHDGHEPHEGHEGQDHDHGSQHAAATVTQAAQELITAVEAFPPRVPQTLLHDFDDSRRRTIDFFPLLVREDQRGLRLGFMALEPRRATHRLLREVLGEEGYLRVQAIRSLESTLSLLTTDTSFVRVPDAYTVQLFGAPSLETPWAFKFEGHHLSVNATLIDGQFRGTPLFLGVSPAEVPTGFDAGLRVLGPQEDLARVLLASFDREQRRAAVEDEFRLEEGIPLGPLVQLGEARGLSAAAMTAEQRALLLQLVASYARNLRPDFAHEELARIGVAGVEALTFSWRGSTVPGQPFSYFVNGPTVAIQLEAVEDPPGSGANHLHSLWRDPERDFGADLLDRHHAEEHSGEH